jgi:hypothetical protein
VVPVTSYDPLLQLVSMLPAELPVNSSSVDGVCYIPNSGVHIFTQFDNSAQSVPLNISITFTKIGGNYVY